MNKEDSEMSALDLADIIRWRVYGFLKDDGRSMSDMYFCHMLYIWKSLDDLITKMTYDGYEEKEDEV